MGSFQSQPKYEQTHIDQQQLNHFSSHFTNICYQKKKQYITIKGYFQQIKDHVEPDMTDIFQVDDSTTVGELKKEWLEKYQNNKYVLEQKQGYAVTLQLRRSLNDGETIAKIRHLLGIRVCNAKVELFIFPEQINNGCMESAISYEVYEQINFFDVETTFKIMYSSPQQPHYFTIKTPRQISIQMLKTKLEQHISQSSQIEVKYDIKKGYRLRIKQDALTKQQINVLYQQLKYNKIEYQLQIQDGFIDFTQLSNYYLRKVCPPGEVIYFIPLDEKFQIIESKEYLESKQNNVEIRITCTKKLQNRYQKIIITENYHTIKNIQVSTLLTQHRVYDAMFTSVGVPNLLIRPYEKFSALDKLISQSNLKTYELTAIPQNLLFYSQLMIFNEPLDLIERLKSKYLGCSKYDKNKFTDRFIERRNSLVQQNDAQRLNDVEAILLYTGPFLYSELNKFMRSNSLAFLNNGVFQQQNWQYPFCSKILKSLDKLANYQGLVYRGSSGYRYKMQEGEVIEWNGFTSTTSDIHIAKKFITKSNNVYPYIFEIETFSGKSIAEFSYYKNESQVLILPYTKFKVMKIITLEDNIKYITLKELPLPKKIPGRLIVWVDPNYRQNAMDFKEIVTKNTLTDIEIVQLESNKHLEMWLQQYSTLICSSLLIEIAFISNMNRPPNYLNEGIRTFDIIRSFSSHAQVVYYIQQPQQKAKILQQAGIHVDNKKVFITSKKRQLQQVIRHNLWKKVD